jgi:hypothetical protein
MKKLVLFSLIFAFIGCRPITITQRYYQEYVSPKPSISYEEIDFDNIPTDFLNTYYDIDSRFVRVANTIDLTENFELTLQSSHPDTQWIKNFASFDADHIFVSGDDVIGYDPVVRKLMDETQEETSFFKEAADRLFWLNIITKEEENKHYLIFEIDKDFLLSLKTSDAFSFVVDGLPLEKNHAFSPERLPKIQKKKQYSGSYREEQKRIYWIRSMAADNLYYFFNHQR